MRNERISIVLANRKKRKIIYTTIMISTSIYLTFTLLLGDNGLLTYLDRKSSAEKVQSEIITISKQNELTKIEIDAFHSKDMFLIERLAREYGYVKPGEVIYKFKDKGPEGIDKAGPLR